jgi:hypothetical protein
VCCALKCQIRGVLLLAMMNASPTTTSTKLAI